MDNDTLLKSAYCMASHKMGNGFCMCRQIYKGRLKRKEFIECLDYMVASGELEKTNMRKGWTDYYRFTDKFRVDTNRPNVILYNGDMKKAYRYLNSKEYFAKCFIFRGLKKFKCDKCGCNGAMKVRHKKLESLFNEDLNDLILYCDKCLPK